MPTLTSRQAEIHFWALYVQDWRGAGDSPAEVDRKLSEAIAASTWLKARDAALVLAIANGEDPEL